MSIEDHIPHMMEWKRPIPVIGKYRLIKTNVPIVKGSIKIIDQGYFAQMPNEDIFNSTLFSGDIPSKEFIDFLRGNLVFESYLEKNNLMI